MNSENIKTDFTDKKLESLVIMAESVSKKIEVLKSKINNLKMKTILFLAILYFLVAFIIIPIIKPDSFSLFQKIDPWFIVTPLLVLAVLSSILISQCFLNLKRFKYTLNKEKEILHYLLDMVFEYRENIYATSEKQIDYVEMAILDIRLKRISFSPDY